KIEFVWVTDGLGQAPCGSHEFYSGREGGLHKLYQHSCALGVTYGDSFYDAGGYVIQLADWDDPQHLFSSFDFSDGQGGSGKSLAHELCHVWGHIIGDDDSDHKGPCFTLGGYTNQADKKLSENGL